MQKVNSLVARESTFVKNTDVLGQHFCRAGRMTVSTAKKKWDIRITLERQTVLKRLIETFPEFKHFAKELFFNH